MIPMTLNDIAPVVGAACMTCATPRRLVTAPPAVDSREVVPGGLFAATVGASVDGHDYAARRRRERRVAVLASRPTACPPSSSRTSSSRSALLARHLLERSARP